MTVGRCLHCMIGFLVNGPRASLLGTSCHLMGSSGESFTKNDVSSCMLMGSSVESFTKNDVSSCMLCYIWHVM